MAEFTIDEVCEATNGKAQRVLTEKQTFTGISTDTRNIKQGDLFVALKGERFDGHNFICQAVNNGASGVLINRTDIDIPENAAVILVENTLKGLQSLARFHRQRFTIPVIAITGSNGKTSTKDMTAAVLASRFNVLKTEANYNNEIGLPLTLLKLTPQHEAAVVEMGMRGIGEIRELADIALPTIGIITNVGETHIELLGSVENIAVAKGELVEAIPPNGLVVLNADNFHVRDMKEKAKGRVVFYSLEQNSDIMATNIRSEGQGTGFDCHCSQEIFSLYLPAVGRHNVYNALAAIAVGLELGLTLNEVKAGLGAFAASGMRLHIEQRGDYVIINDAYNASPLSMSAAIDTLAEIASGRTVAVLGDMLELGHIAVEAHRRIGRKLAERGVKMVITVGELAGYIAETAREYGVSIVVDCKNHDQAKENLQKLLKPGDTILIKGSRGMKMENIIEMFT